MLGRSEYGKVFYVEMWANGYTALQALCERAYHMHAKLYGVKRADLFLSSNKYYEFMFMIIKKNTIFTHSVRFYEYPTHWHTVSKLFKYVCVCVCNTHISFLSFRYCVSFIIVLYDQTSRSKTRVGSIYKCIVYTIHTWFLALFHLEHEQISTYFFCSFPLHMKLTMQKTLKQRPNKRGQSELETDQASTKIIHE